MSATFITCGNKVTTAHCVDALHDEGKKIGLPYEIFNLTNWKRLSKYQTAEEACGVPDIRSSLHKHCDSDDVIVLREFANKMQSNYIGLVWSVNEKILGVKIIKLMDTGMRETIKNSGDEWRGEWDIYPTQIPWGTLPSEKREGESTMEVIDFENSEWYELTDSSLQMSAGGDWQQGATFSAYLGDDGLVYYIKFLSNDTPKTATTLDVAASLGFPGIDEE